MKHYSASQINMYMRCPAQWFFRYVEGYKQPPTAAMIQGTSYHKGVEINYAQKIQSKKDLPIDDVLDAYATEFGNRIIEAEDTPEKDRGELKDQGVGLIKAYHETLAPTIQPIAVEKPFTIDFDNVDYTVEGFVDVIAEGGFVRENKTTAKTPNAVSEDHFVQGTLYALAEDVDAVTYDYAVKLKTPKVVTLTVEIPDHQKAFVLGMVGKIDHAIRSEVFYPNRGSFMCSRRNCGFWSQCERKHGGRVKD